MSINQQIIAFVDQNPDHTAAAISRAVGAKMKTTASALSKMVRAGTLNRVRSNSFRRAYVYVKPVAAQA